MNNGKILIAEIGAPVGLKGQVKAKVFSGNPYNIENYDDLRDKSGRCYRARVIRVDNAGRAVLALSGVESREAAERLKGKELYVERDKFPETEDNEFYLADVIGMDVADVAGKTMGAVIATHNYGAGDILEIKFTGGDSELISFADKNFPNIDIKKRVITMIKPEYLDEEPS